MKNWTRFDLGLISTALLLTLVMFGYRFYNHYSLESSANAVAENIQSVADSVAQFHLHTGNWFPLIDESSDVRMRIHLDPFDERSIAYQGLDQEKLWRENNFGMVLQLVRFSSATDAIVGRRLFAEPYRENEPYLRILLDYGHRGQVETIILTRVEELLPEGALAEIDDHYYVVDLRRLIDEAG